MNIKPILLVAGEPKSVFIEIFFKSIKKKEIYKSININMLKKRIEKSNEKI